MYIFKYLESLNEGIDYDSIKRTVSFNPSHENNVDTSFENNPTVDHLPFDDSIEIWSVFKRNSGTYYDGNPLIYAMKGEKGWKFRSEYDKKKVYDAIDFILRKYFFAHLSDVTIMVPSRGKLNEQFLEMVNKYNPNAVVITDIIRKMSVEEVIDAVLEPDSKFREVFGGSAREFEYAFHELESDANRMGEFFRCHFVKNPDIRNAIESTIKIENGRVGQYMEAINGKNLLIIDDNFSMGKTIESVCTEIKRYYSPKSITVLTLFSKKYNEFNK